MDTKKIILNNNYQMNYYNKRYQGSYQSSWDIEKFGFRVLWNGVGILKCIGELVKDAVGTFCNVPLDHPGRLSAKLTISL